MGAPTKKQPASSPDSSLNGARQNSPEPPKEQLSGSAGSERSPASDYIRSTSVHAARKRKPSTLKKTLLIAGGVALCVLLFFVVKFVVDVSNPAGLFDSPTPTPAAEETVAPAATGQTPAVATPDPEQALLSQADLEFMKNRVNILVVGIDESTERENWGSFRTDTMILVSINFDNNDVDMISIPRDSFVKIYSAKGGLVTSDQNVTGMNKINSAFSSGGGSKKNGYGYACMTVSKLLGGIPVNYYLGFNMNVVKQVVDAMGGVDYNVDITVNMNGRTLQPGQQHLNGQQVLDYCRQRKGSSDIARVDRQQRMIMTIFQQLKSTGQIVNIPSIYQAVETNIETNLNFTQISSLALLALKMDQSQLERHTVDGGFLNVQNTSYWGVSTSKLKKLVSDVFGINAAIDSDIDINNIKAAIEANRAAIAGELALAESTISSAEALLAQYGSLMSADAKAQIQAAIENLQTAIDLEDKAQLDSATAALSSLVAQQKAIFEPTVTPLIPIIDPFATPTPSTGLGTGLGGI